MMPLPAAVAAAGALGALQTVSHVHTWAWPVHLLCVAALFLLVRQAAAGRAAALGWAFGTAWLVAGTWWLFISMHRYGGLPAGLAALAVLALSAALSLYLAAAMVAFARWRSGRPAPDVVGFAALWLAAELARAQWFTGFPWVAGGYAHVDGPLATLAPWLGVYGMGAAATALAAVAAQAAWPMRPSAGGTASRVRRAAAGAAVAAVLGAMAWAGPPSFTQPAGRLTVSLLQTNVAQDEKFALEHLPGALQWVRDALIASTAQLVVAPETAVPLLPDQLAAFDAGYWPTLQAHFRAAGRAALVGVPLGDYDQGYTNSVVGLSAAPPYRYDKHHLVPFGEFIPTGFRWFTEMMHIPLGDFARGPVDAPSFAVAGQRLAPNICYEDLFGEELAVRFRNAAAAPTVLVNVSNIGWFGNTVAIPQHLNISRLRSLELQRPMLRATNTGATAVIDHQGRVTATLPPHARAILDAEVEGRTGRTPFATWAGEFGLWPLWAAAAAGVGAMAWSRAARLHRRG